MWSEEGSACPSSAGRAFNITQVPPGGVKCSFPSFPHTLLLAPLPGSLTEMMNHARKVGHISGLHKLTHFWGSSTLLMAAIYLFVSCMCFSRLITCTISLLSGFQKLGRKKKKTHKLNAHGETKLLSKTAQALHPSSKTIPHPHGSHSTFLPRILEICSSTKELGEGKDVFEFPSRLVKRTTRPSRVLRPHRQAVCTAMNHIKSAVSRCSFSILESPHHSWLFLWLGGKYKVRRLLPLERQKFPDTPFLPHFPPTYYTPSPDIKCLFSWCLSQESNLIKSLILRCSWCVLFIPCIFMLFCLKAIT